MLIGVGGLLMFICIVWFVLLSVQTGASTGEKVVWVIVSILFQPLAGIIFYFVKGAGLIPLILGLIGVVFYGYSIMTSLGEVMN